MKALPRLVILGFPNVGKSTLFNSLVQKKTSLVHSLPGMTRDAVSAFCVLGGKALILTDTGGLDDSSGEVLASAIREKAWSAARKADGLLLVLDAKRELAPAEEALFLDLKKLGRPLLLVLNKVDSQVQEGRIGDFYNRLRGEAILAVSAEQRRNLDVLEERIGGLLAGRPSAGEEEIKPLAIAVIGRINVGKSSLINRLCGEERLVVSNLPGTTRDSTDTFVVRGKKIFRLVDTAGIRRLSRTRDEREKAGILRAKKAVERADVLCLVMDAQEFPTRQDIGIVHLAYESGKPLLLALNKWDLASVGEFHREIRERIYRRLPFVSYAPLLFVSALTGKRVAKILDLAEDVYARASRRVETPRLNEFLNWVNGAHPPLTKTRRKLKIKYMTQQGVRPPTFLLFAHRPAALLPAYEKFFLGLLRQRFGLQGSPLRLRMRKS